MGNSRRFYFGLFGDNADFRPEILLVSWGDLCLSLTEFHDPNEECDPPSSLFPCGSMTVGFARRNKFTEK